MQFDLSLSSQYKPVTNWAAFEANISEPYSEIGKGLSKQTIESKLYFQSN